MGLDFIKNIFDTGFLFFIMAVVLRKCSEDEAAIWWKIVVVLLGCIGLGSVFISSIILIWA